MNFRNFVQNAVASYVSKKSRGTLFIKHYNTLDIDKNDILAQTELPEGTVCLYHEYAMHEMHSSYDPIVTWIRYLYETYYAGRMTAEEFLRECGVYSLHIDILAGLIVNDRCTRAEDMLYFEAEYEIERMKDNLVRIIEHISEEYPLLLIISKLHLAPFSTIKLLNAIVEKSLNIQIVLMFNDEFVITDFKKNAWNELLQTAGNKALLLEWGSLDTEKTIDMQDEFWFDKSYTSEYYNRLRNMYYTFCLEDAYHYMSNIMNRIEEKTVRFEREMQIKFLFLAADIYMTFGKSDMALVMCDKLTDLKCNRSDDLRLRYDHYYTYARARMFAGQDDYVKKCCAKCIAAAREMGNEFLEYRAQTLTYVVESTMGHDLFHYEFHFHANDDIVEKAKKHGFWNFLSYIYVFGFDNDPPSLRSIAMGEKVPHYFDLAIEIGKRLDNRNFLLNAYMKNTILYSEAGYHRFVRDVYDQRLKVLGRPKPVSMAHFLAGLGYNSVILEEFEQAHAYLCQSVTNLANIEQAQDMQPNDTMNSLYNLALVHLVAENYRGLVNVVELILKMLNKLNYKSIRACSTIKLYSFIAIGCFYLKEYHNCYVYLWKIETIVERMINYLQEHNEGNYDEDLVLYHLIKGMMCSYEKKFDRCLPHFDFIKENLDKVFGSLFYIMPIYSVERASVYYKQGMDEAGDAVIDEGIQFCEKNELPRKRERLCWFKEHHERMAEPIVEKEDELPIDKVMGSARRVGKELKLLKRDKEIQFLTMLQEMIGRENMSVDELFLNTSALIKNSFNLDEIIILRRRNGKREFMIENEVQALSNDDFDSILDFFRTYKYAFLANCTDERFSQFMPVMSFFSDVPIMTIVGIPLVEEAEATESVLLGFGRVERRSVSCQVLPNSDDLVILKNAFTQFCNMMRFIDNRSMIEKMSHRLEQSAVTDQLTGITNRIGFSRQEEIICAQDNGENNVLLYCDLDNFKYYNDTFGHDIGDLVLVSFAKLIKRIADRNGLAVRYGGDEFIVLLYNNTEREGVEFAQRIYDELSGGFVDEIRGKLRKDIDIPNEKKISCSIGITEFKGGSKVEFKLAMDRADKMMYYVKKHGKSTYKIYDPKEDL